MVQYELEIGEEEKNILMEIALQSNINRKKRQKAAPLCLVLAFAFLFLGIRTFFYGPNLAMFIYLMLTAFSFFLTMGGSKMFQKVVLKRAMAKADTALYSGKRNYIFDDNGVEITSFAGNGRYYWSSFKYWGTLNHYIYIRRIDNQVILIDKNKLSKNELNELLELLANISSELI